MGHAVEKQLPLRFVLLSLLVHIGMLVALGGFQREVGPQGEGEGVGGYEMVYLSSPGEDFSGMETMAEIGLETLKALGEASGSSGSVGERSAAVGQTPGSPWGGPYLTEVRRQIDRAFIYPRLSLRRGEEGTVRLQLAINEEGSLTDLKILGSSGFITLDEAAVRATRQAAPFSPPPPQYANIPHTISFIISVGH